jgi:hypothetical protein
MGARAASGTLAGSASSSWASSHKEAARSDFSRVRRHPRVLRLAHLCRRSRGRTSSSGATPQPNEKQKSEIGVVGRARFVRRGGPTPRAGGRLSAAAGCGEHTIRWSPTVKTTGPTRLPQPWQRHREAGATARAEAVVAGPARGCLDVGDRSSARSGGRRRSSSPWNQRRCSAPTPAPIRALARRRQAPQCAFVANFQGSAPALVVTCFVGATVLRRASGLLRARA